MKKRDYLKQIIGLVIGLVAFGAVSAQSAAPQALPMNGGAQKKAWIEANPSEYQRMGGQQGAQAPEFSTQTEKDAWVRNQDPSKDPSARIGIDHPSFPKYVSTGNPDLDNANYESAKNEWIAKNPALYEAVGTEKELPMSREERLVKYNGKE